MVQTEQMDIDVVDLCTPVNGETPVASTTPSIVSTSIAAGVSVVSDITSTNTVISRQTSYESRTLTSNSVRYSILPACTTSIENDHPNLLLANVPSKYRVVAVVIMHVCLSCVKSTKRKRTGRVDEQQSIFWMYD